MKKFFSIFVCVVMLLTVICLPVLATADAEDVVFTIGEITGKPGDIVSVPVTVATKDGVTYDSVGLRDLTYDKTVLEFVGFADTEAILAKCYFGSFDDDIKVVAFALKEPMALSGKICSIRFEILADVQDGSHSVGMTSIIKRGSDFYTSSVTPGVVESKHEHVMTYSAATAATCVADGNVENYYCSFCKTYYADAEGSVEIADIVLPIDPDNHNFEDGWTITADDHYHYCVLCEGEFDRDGHIGGEATCITKATCDVCRADYIDIDPNNHKGETELRGACPATREADGYTGDTYCLDCETVIEAGEVLPQIQVVFTLSDVTAASGDTIEVQLTVVSDTAIDSIGLRDLSFDSSVLTFVRFEDTTEIIDACILSSFDNDLNVITLGLKEKQALTGFICTLVFEVNETAKDGAYEIGMASIIKNGSENVGSEVEGATVTVENYLPGDIDMNRVVDISDALALFRFSMMPDLYPVKYPGPINFDNKGDLDISDALRLFQYSLMPDMYPLFPAV